MGLIGGGAAGVVLVLVILGFIAWFFKFKKTNIGKKIKLYYLKVLAIRL